MGLEGAMRFLKRLWALAHEHIEQGPAPVLDVAALSDAGVPLRRKTHSTLAKADDDYGRRLHQHGGFGGDGTGE